MDLTNLSSNWKQLQATLATQSPKPQTFSARTPHVVDTTQGRKRKRRDHFSSRPNPRKKPNLMELTETSSISVSRSTNFQPNGGLNPSVQVGQYVALDCEMVGLAPNGIDSVLARVSIVNYDGDCIYDSYVLPQPGQHVVDYRTAISGIRARDMRHARPFATVQEDVKTILDGRIVVGHALRHDWAVLGLIHPKENVRDTSKHKPYRQLVGGGTPALKLLVSMALGLEIQGGEHSSLEDARAVMALFRRDKALFAGGEGEREKRDAKRRGKWR